MDKKKCHVTFFWSVFLRERRGYVVWPHWKTYDHFKLYVNKGSEHKQIEALLLLPNANYKAILVQKNVKVQQQIFNMK